MSLYGYSTPRQAPNRDDEEDRRKQELKVWEQRLDELEKRVGEPGPSTPAKEQERKALEDSIATNTIRVAQLRERLVAAQKRQVCSLCSWHRDALLAGGAVFMTVHVICASLYCTTGDCSGPNHSYAARPRCEADHRRRNGLLRSSPSSLSKET